MNKYLISMLLLSPIAAANADEALLIADGASHDFQCTADVTYATLGDDICLHGHTGKIVSYMPKRIVKFGERCAEMSVEFGGVNVLRTADGSTLALPVVQDVKLNSVACPEN